MCAHSDVADRASLGARIAEAMGLPYVGTSSTATGIATTSHVKLNGEWVSPEVLVSWEGYGIVDAWMREQGWQRYVNRLATGDVNVKYEGRFSGRWYVGQAWNDHDEPLAAIQAALKALEARE